MRSGVHPFAGLLMACLQYFVLLGFRFFRVRARLCALLRNSARRRAVVDLLRPVGNIGLLHERGLPWVLQVNQRRCGCPALRLRFQRQPQIRPEDLYQLLPRAPYKNLAHRKWCLVRPSERYTGDYGTGRTQVQLSITLVVACVDEGHGAVDKFQNR